MDEPFELLSSPRAFLALLRQPETWHQATVLALGLVVAWLIGRFLQQRLQPVVEPGVIHGAPRTAVRTGVLALVPIMLWLWLLAAVAIFRRLQLPVDVLRPALVLAGAAALIRMGVFVLRHNLSPGSRLKAWEGALAVTIWVLVALHILGWLPHIEQFLDEYAVTVGKVRISVYNAVTFALSSAVMLFVALGLANALEWRVHKSKALEESLKIAIVKLGKFLLLTAAVVTALVTAGIDLTAFAVFGGALGVGLGLGLQRIVSNFVSGIILGFEGSIRPGDVISVGNNVGVVQELHARHTVVRTRDGRDLLLPNEVLLTSEITNLSYGDRNVRLGLPVQISYRDDPEAAIELLVKVALAHPRVLRDPPPQGLLMGFGDSGINLELRAWVCDPEHGFGNVRSEINREIWKALKAAGITIPYPHREVHFKGMVPGASPSGDK
jgi:small-conductance mechanosensitive channel